MKLKNWGVTELLLDIEIECDCGETFTDHTFDPGLNDYIECPHCKRKIGFSKNTINFRLEKMNKNLKLKIMDGALYILARMERHRLIKERGKEVTFTQAVKSILRLYKGKVEGRIPLPSNISQSEIYNIKKSLQKKILILEKWLIEDE
jgi:hypothetical protein